MAKPRIVVIVNKWWELDPVMHCLLSDYARPTTFQEWPILNDHPRPRRNPTTPTQKLAAVPRAVFDPANLRIEVWCVSDLLEHLPDKGKWQSSSERKAERIPDIFSGDEIMLSIAVGTAASGDPESRNGSVVIGTKCFLHNSKPNNQNPDSNWDSGPFDTIIDSTLTCDEFSTLTMFESSLLREASSKFFFTPNSPARDATFLSDYEAVALGNINVSDYRQYTTTDIETVDAFRNKYPTAPLGSLETTHGLLRVLGSDRFIFLSGIVDRLGRFHEDVDPRPYAQNTTGAHNAGIAVANLLSRIKRIL